MDGSLPRSVDLHETPEVFFNPRVNKVKVSGKYRSCREASSFSYDSEPPCFHVIFVYGGDTYSLVGESASVARLRRVGDVVVAASWSVVAVVNGTSSEKKTLPFADVPVELSQVKHAAF